MISVCIATYNGEDIILTQLKSILPQLGKEDEIVISDDGSQDDTVDRILSLNDSRINIIKGPCLGSAIPNFENALQHCKGDYIFLSDQDDKWMPHKVETCMKKFEEGYACIVTDSVVTDMDFNVINPSFNQLNHMHPGRYYNLLVKNSYLGGSMAFTREVLQKSLPFPKDIPMHDIWIGNIAAFFFNVCFIPQTCSYLRRGDHNATNTAGKSNYSLWKKIGLRWAVVKDLLKRAVNGK